MAPPGPPRQKRVEQESLVPVLCPRKGQEMRFRQCFQSDEKEESTLNLAGFSRQSHHPNVLFLHFSLV